MTSTGTRSVTATVLAAAVLALPVTGAPSSAVDRAPAGTAGPNRTAVDAGAPRPPRMPEYPYGPGSVLSPDQNRVPGATARISPRTVHPGDTITVTFGASSADVAWAVADLPALATDGPCASGSPRGTGLVTCRLRVSEDAGTVPRWLTLTVGFTWSPSCTPAGCFQTTTFRDYVALVPPGEAVLRGSVRDRDDRMVPGVAVDITGRGRRYATRTDGAGTFAALLPQGTWTVTPRGTWDPPSRTVRLGRGGGRADFVAPVAEVRFDIDGSHLVAGLDWTTGAASGLVRRSGWVRARTQRGTPLADTVVQLDAPYPDGGSPGTADSTGIVVCDGTWRPMFARSWRAERRTDADGRVRLHLLLGSRIGVSLFHARLADDVTALDVERIGLTGTVTGPSTPDVVAPLQNARRLGLPVPTLAARRQPALQSALTEWWLAYRAGPHAGPGALAATGEFVPIRNGDGSAGGIAFYPGGNPDPLRAHLVGGAALPADYPVVVLSFRRVPLDPVTGLVHPWLAALDSLPDLATWEAQHGAARAGYLGARAGLGGGWLGGPYPPPVADAADRAHFDRCVPGASPP